jgi:formate dehydrogenase major subunit
VWGAPVPERAGLNLMRMLDAAAAGSLKALWAVGYDVLLTNPNVAATREALGALELVVVQDLFLNETAREFGTVFLPAASPFEKDGTFMNAERRVQRVRAALEPAGGSRPDWQIVCDVAREMGKGELFDFHSAREIWDEVRAVWPAGAGISYDRLEKGGLQWPCPSEDHPGTTVLHADSFPHGPRAALRRVAAEPPREVASDEYPYVLMTGRTLYQFNAGTMTMRTPNAKLRPSDLLEVSAEDAGRLGVRDGERVTVRSRYGAATLPAHVTAAVRPGEVFATFHTTAVYLNSVTSPVRDRHVDTPENKVTAVSLERCAGPG